MESWKINAAQPELKSTNAESKVCEFATFIECLLWDRLKPYDNGERNQPPLLPPENNQKVHSLERENNNQHLLNSFMLPIGIIYITIFHANSMIYIFTLILLMNKLRYKKCFKKQKKLRYRLFNCIAQVN